MVQIESKLFAGTPPRVKSLYNVSMLNADVFKTLRASRSVLKTMPSVEIEIIARKTAPNCGMKEKYEIRNNFRMHSYIGIHFVFGTITGTYFFRADDGVQNV